MTAPDFTPDELATLQRIEAADDAPESLRHKVAAAIEIANLSPGPLGSPVTYGDLADAAIQAVKQAES